MLEDIPLELWEYIFRNMLDIYDLCRLSEVSKNMYYICHNIKSFSELKINPYNDILKIPLVLNIDQVKSWKNIIFVKIVHGYLRNICISNIFHTWGHFPNIRYHICRINDDKRLNIVSKYKDKIYYVFCKGHNISRFSEDNTLKIRHISIDGDFPDLKLVNTLSVYMLNPGNSDLTPFSRLVDFISSGGYNIVDVSPLKNVPNVTIVDSPKLVDISPLKNCKSVNVSECKAIVDFSPLENVLDVTVNGTYIDDLSVFKKTQILSLSRCTRIINVEKLKYLKTLKRLTFYSSNWVFGFSYLDNVEIIR
jgi:hypothetical protein